MVRLHQICDAALDAKLRRLPDARPHRAGAFSRPVCDAPAQPPEQGKARRTNRTVKVGHKRYEKMSRRGQYRVVSAVLDGFGGVRSPAWRRRGSALERVLLRVHRREIDDSGATGGVAEAVEREVEAVRAVARDGDFAPRREEAPSREVVYELYHLGVQP